jgi:glycosyltransferase involved in cell wall biosynthesis
MRIIYYSPHPTHDIVSEVGYSTHQREVILALQKEGHTVLPLVMGGTETSNLNPLASGLYKAPSYKRLFKALLPKWIWTSLNNYKLLKHDQLAAQRLETEILNEIPDLIYERSEYLQDSGAKMASKYKIKYFLEVNAPFVEEMRNFEGYSLYQNKAHRIEKYKVSKADQIFCVSSALAQFLINRYHCNENLIVVQPNCINPEKIKFNPDTVEELRKKLNFENQKVLGFVGSMFPYHGVDLLIDAFKKVQENHKNVKLLLVGDGQILEKLKRLSHDLNLEDRIVFTGKIPHSEVFNYIQLMDICIMAKSNWYGSPVKLFEYGLMQKPIIAPDTLPVRDVIENGKHALLIEENEEQLQRAIEKLISDETFANQIAKSFHQKVMTHYTWKHAAEKIIELCA